MHEVHGLESGKEVLTIVVIGFGVGLTGHNEHGFGIGQVADHAGLGEGLVALADGIVEFEDLHADISGVDDLIIFDGEIGGNALVFDKGFNRIVLDGAVGGILGILCDDDAGILADIIFLIEFGGSFAEPVGDIDQEIGEGESLIDDFGLHNGIGFGTIAAAAAEAECAGKQADKHTLHKQHPFYERLHRDDAEISKKKRTAEPSADDQTDKPSSVVCDNLSRPYVAIWLKPPLPDPSIEPMLRRSVPLDVASDRVYTAVQSPALR